MIHACVHLGLAMRVPEMMRDCQNGRTGTRDAGAMVVEIRALALDDGMCNYRSRTTRCHDTSGQTPPPQTASFWRRATAQETRYAAVG